MKKYVMTGSLAIVSIGVIAAGTAWAAGYTWSPGGEYVEFRGSEEDTLTIDVDGDPDDDYECQLFLHADQAILQSQWPAPGFIALTRHSGQTGNAHMRSSSGAEVEVRTNRDVILRAGRSPL